MCGKDTVYHLEVAELWMCSSPAFAFRDSRRVNSTLQKDTGHCGQPRV